MKHVFSLLAILLSTSLVATSGVYAQSLTPADSSGRALTLSERADATRRLQLAGQAVSYNPPRDAILQSGLSSHPMFQQVFARMDMNKFNQQAAILMAQTFTTQELQALVNFSGSPVGQSIRNKMPSFQKMLGAMAQNEMAAAMQSYAAAQGQVPGQTPGTLPGLNGVGSPLR